MEQIAEAFHEMSKKKDLAVFCIGEVSVYATLAGMLTADNAPVEDAIRIRKKHFGALERITELAKSDEILCEQILETYKTDDPKAWLLHRLLNSPHPQFVKLRENPKYAEMLRQMDDANTL